jgi:hypothetical protein
MTKRKRAINQTCEQFWEQIDVIVPESLCQYFFFPFNISLGGSDIVQFPENLLYQETGEKYRYCVLELNLHCIRYIFSGSTRNLK